MSEDPEITCVQHNTPFVSINGNNEYWYEQVKGVRNEPFLSIGNLADELLGKPEGIKLRNSTAFVSTSGQNKEWLEQHEQMLKSWKARCFVNMWLQKKSAYYFNVLHISLSYPVIIISSVGGATLFCVKSVLWNYVVGVLCIISGVFMAIIRQMKPGELCLAYSITTRKYQVLIRKIDTVLDLDAYMRKLTPEEFIESVILDMDAIAETQLYPPSFVVSKFEKKFGSLHELLYGKDIEELLRRDLEIRREIKNELSQVDKSMRPNYTAIFKKKSPGCLGDNCP